MRTQTFGIEIETTGLGRQPTAEVIAKYFGTTAQYIGAHLDDWKIPMPDGRRWTVESDGSVTDPSAEVVSPVCRWEDIEMVQTVVRALRKAGAKVDSTCGIHIHIGLGEHTPRDAPQSGEHHQRQRGSPHPSTGHQLQPARTLVQAGGACLP